MRKRLLAILLALTLVVSLMPVGVMAVEGLDGGDTTQPQTTSSVSTASDSPVQITKSVEKTGNGNYELTMEAYVTGNVSPSTTAPLDIVLVLDVSGSMDDPFGEMTSNSHYEPYGEHNNGYFWDNRYNLYA